MSTSMSTGNVQALVSTTTPTLVSHPSVYSNIGRPPASRWAVEMMPRVTIVEKGACVICLEEWLKGDMATELPCKHKYHFECVKKWLGIHATCPLCRYEMPLEGEEEIVKNAEVDDDDDDEDSSDYYDSDSDE